MLKVFDGIGNFVDTLLGRTSTPVNDVESKPQTQTEKKA